MKFEKYELSEPLLQNLHAKGYFRTTDIQFKAIASILRGEDVLAIAQTGTGKTAAFAIPVIERLHQQKSSKRVMGVRCLVMVPTRELAEQIGEVFNALTKHTRVKAFAVYGGLEQDPQIKRLQEGLDVVIATPGRMFRLIREGFLSVKHIDTLILDEADRMLGLGFLEDVKAIKRELKGRHQTLFFSATINPEIKKLAYSQVRASAIRIQISPEDPVSKNITHFVMFVEMDDKRFFLTEYLRQNPDGKFIIFVRTRVRAERLAKTLAKAEIQSQTIHGEKDQVDRNEVMAAFRAGSCRLLIATDVSARGIDVPDVTHVINYDLPEKAENYVHRIGRTGRGFNKGIAVSFCSSLEKPLLVEIETLIGHKIDVMKVRQDHYEVVKVVQNTELSVMDLIEAEENFRAQSKRKGKKRR